MSFCPSGVSTIVQPQSGSPVTVSLTGLDPESGIVRITSLAGSQATVDFGNGSVLLADEVEFFKIPSGATSLTVGSNNVKVCVTIGEFV